MSPGTEDPHDEELLAQLVLAYLREHPGAMDTLNGIAAWWIRRPGMRVDNHVLSRVLEALADNGKLEVIRSGSAILYSLKTRRTET